MEVVLQIITIGLPYACFVAVVHLGWPKLVAQPPDQHPLDVLRGMCASLVFTAHALKVHTLVTTGSPFDVPPAFNPVILLGDTGVVLFFYITGYLFFGAAYPRGERVVDVLVFLQRRFRRLAPAFGFTACVALLLHMLSTDRPLLSIGLLRDALHIFSFGMYLGRLPNEDPLMWLAINITWSLKFEWKFYFIIAVSMVFAFKRLVAACALGGFILALYALERTFEATFMGYLLAGAWAGVLRARHPWSLPGPALILWLYDDTNAALAYLVFALCLCIRQMPLWLRPLATAGNVTYSYYLIHGSALLLVHAATRSFWAPTGLDTLDLYLFLTLAACAAAGAALGMYRWLEAPYFRARHAQTLAQPQSQIQTRAAEHASLSYEPATSAYAAAIAAAPTKD